MIPHPVKPDLSVCRESYGVATAYSDKRAGMGARGSTMLF
jgi:hypothetical protein